MINNKILMTTALAGIIGFSSAPAISKNPYSFKYTDESFISLTGDVVSTYGKYFTLDFGEGLITVEMDDWDWYNENQHILTGDKVTVLGRIDNDLFESKKIEAGSVHVHSINTTYYADSADEEDYAPIITYYSYPVTIPDGTWMSISGIVEDIDDREFELNTGSKTVKIDTKTMNYNPLDNIGFQKIKEGDKIYVSGRLDINFFEDNEIDANSIVTLQKDKKNKS